MHSPKVLDLMTEIEDGIEICVSDEHLAKASDPIDVTDVGMNNYSLMKCIHKMHFLELKL